MMPYDPNRHHRRSIRLRGYDYRQPGAYFVTICAHGRQRLFGAIDGDVLRPNEAGHMVSRWWQELGAKFPAVIPDASVVMPDHFHGIVMIVAPGDGSNAGDGPNAGDDVNADDGPNAGDDVNAGDGPNAGGYANPPLRDDADVWTMGIDDSTGNTGDADVWTMGSDDSTGNIGDADVWTMGSDDSTGNTLVADSYIRPRRNPIDRANPSVNSDSNAASLSHIIQWFKIMTTTDYIRHVKQSGWAPFDRRVWQRGYYEHIIRDARELHAVRRYIAVNPARWAVGRDDLDALLARMEERI